jgi:hypothetical protein
MELLCEGLNENKTIKVLNLEKNWLTNKSAKMVEPLRERMTIIGSFDHKPKPEPDSSSSAAILSSSSYVEKQPELPKIESLKIESSSPSSESPPKITVKRESGVREIENERDFKRRRLRVAIEKDLKVLHMLKRKTKEFKAKVELTILRNLENFK